MHAAVGRQVQACCAGLKQMILVNAIRKCLPGMTLCTHYSNKTDNAVSCRGDASSKPRFLGTGMSPMRKTGSLEANVHTDECRNEARVLLPTSIEADRPFHGENVELRKA